MEGCSPDFVDRLMKQSAKELVQSGQKDNQKFAQSIPSKTTDRVVNGTNHKIIEYVGRAKFVLYKTRRYGDLYCLL